MPGYELIDDAEKNNILSIFETNNGVLFAHGFNSQRSRFFVREFEASLQSFFGVHTALPVSSGTASLKIAFKVLNIGPGDEVITPSFNFIATIEAILDVGATPVICPCTDNLYLDQDCLKSLITNKTKAIVPVHMLGYPDDIVSIHKLAKSLNIYCIEDACEAVGSSRGNAFIGTLSDFGVFSFDFGKMITTGEGGCLLTNNLKFSELSRQYHDHGHLNLHGISRGNDRAGIAGFNYRITEMQGAIGLAQLKKLPLILSENKFRVDKLMKSSFIATHARSILPEMNPTFDTLVLCNLKREEVLKLVDLLNSEGVGTKNVPDALNWHCSYQWGHCLSDDNITRSESTYTNLMLSVAIPISLNFSLGFYANLADKVTALFSE